MTALNSALMPAYSCSSRVSMRLGFFPQLLPIGLFLLKAFLFLSPSQTRYLGTTAPYSALEELPQA